MRRRWLVSERYAKALLLDPAAIRAGHRAMVEKVFSDLQA